MHDLLKMFFINQFIATVIALLLTVIIGDVSFFTGRLLVSTVYSHFIGTMSYFYFKIKLFAFLRKNIIAILLGEVAVVITATASANALLKLLWGYDISSNAGRVILLNVAVGIIATVVAYRFFVYESSILLKSKRILQLEKENALAKLASLRARVNPHFLFNTLSVLAELAYISPEKVESTVMSLSRLYRAVLDEHRELVRLEEEMSLVKDYLEVEKMRLEERLDYEFLIDRVADDVLVPLLSVQAMVENAVIHGISKKRMGGKIIVSARPGKNATIQLQVCDDGNGFNTGERHDGFGLKGIRDRPDLAYGRKASLHIWSEAGAGSRITMEVPREHAGLNSGG